jgi:TPR repeat protein
MNNKLIKQEEQIAGAALFGKNNKEFYFSKKFLDALEKFQLSANIDHIEAIYRTAKIYHKDLNQENNLERAVILYKLAAKNGHEEAINDLYDIVSIYKNGTDGVEKDLSKASKLLGKIVSVQFPGCQNNVYNIANGSEPLLGAVVITGHC